jgi:hypothetical protein
MPPSRKKRIHARNPRTQREIMATNNTTEFTPVPGAIVEKEGPRDPAIGAPPPLAVIPRRFAAEVYPDAQFASGNSADANENPRPELRDGISLAAKSARDDEFGGGSDDSAASQSENPAAIAPNATNILGPNNERLDDLKPRVVAALRDLMLQFRSEGIVARRSEIRRIKQARLFWQGLQYAWWNPGDMSWHLPFDSQSADDKSLDEMPRYQFVTNLYQAFGLSFIALVSQDTPATRFYPQSAQSDIDVLTARAASDVAALVEENNKVQQLLTGVGYYLWTDGKIGGYVRYVSDAQRFGWHSEDIVEEALVRLGEDAYVCAHCGHETVTPTRVSADSQNKNADRSVGATNAAANSSQDANKENVVIQNGGRSGRSEGSAFDSRPNGNSRSFVANSAPLDDNINPNAADENADKNVGATNAASQNFLSGAICPQCGAQLSHHDFRRAPVVAIPRVTGVRRVPNGQEVIAFSAASN